MHGIAQVMIEFRCTIGTLKGGRKFCEILELGLL